MNIVGPHGEVVCPACRTGKVTADANVKPVRLVCTCGHRFTNVEMRRFVREVMEHNDTEGRGPSMFGEFLTHQYDISEAT